MRPVARDDPVVVNYNGVSLRQSDREVLRGPDRWVTDRIISFYFETLARETYPDRRDWLFVSAEMSHSMRIKEPEATYAYLEELGARNMAFIFFPINESETKKPQAGSHWSLLVFSRPERAFYHYDSLRHTNLGKILPMVEQMMEPLNIPLASIRLEHVEQQGNRYNGGMHMLCNLDLVTWQILNTGRVAGVVQPDYVVFLTKRQEIMNLMDLLVANQNAGNNPAAE